MFLSEKPLTYFRVAIDFRLPNFAAKKDERPVPNMEAILLEAAGSRLFGEADLVHEYFQIPINPDATHIHLFRGEDALSLYEPTRTFKRFKSPSIHMQVHTTKILLKFR